MAMIPPSLPGNVRSLNRCKTATGRILPDLTAGDNHKVFAATSEPRRGHLPCGRDVLCWSSALEIGRDRRRCPPVTFTAVVRVSTWDQEAS